ncbi:hypothetical protein V2J09_013942 [Rumex salicifolius]
MQATSYTNEPWRSLEGKVVMVTGASSGLGYEFCVNLANAGCKLIAAARRTDRLQSLCHLINSESTVVRVIPVELDVTTDVEAAIQKAWDAFGRIDALINNAGVRGSVKSALDLDEEEWKSTIETNQTGTWLVSKHVAKRMRDAKLGGSIINISSVGSLDGGMTLGSIAYAASKSAVNTISKMMALELGPYNIRVNAVAPGIFKSEITHKLMDKTWLRNFEEKAIPLKSLGMTDPALTSLLRYLIHDSSEYITGNVYVVDSGYILPSLPIFSSLLLFKDYIA